MTQHVHARDRVVPIPPKSPPTWSPPHDPPPPHPRPLDVPEAAVVLEATRLAYAAGKSPLAKAKIRQLLAEGADLIGGAA